MRDWNCYNFANYTIMPNVEPYLWEIETFHIFRIQIVIRVEPYLWEIETQMMMHSLVGTPSRWTVPMRDWNFPPRRATLIVPKSWTVPMRDWNQLVLESRKWMILILLNRTYERLKRYQVGNSQSFHLYNVPRWTVPMRDWNVPYPAPDVRTRMIGLSRTYRA